MKGIGDVASPHIKHITKNLGLIIGNLDLSLFEGKLSDAWLRCVDRDESAFRVTSSFYRIIEMAAKNFDAHLVLIDDGPNLGAIGAHYNAVKECYKEFKELARKIAEKCDFSNLLRKNPEISP